MAAGVAGAGEQEVPWDSEQRSRGFLRSPEEEKGMRSTPGKHDDGILYRHDLFL